MRSGRSAGSRDAGGVRTPAWRRARWFPGCTLPRTRRARRGGVLERAPPHGHRVRRDRQRAHLGGVEAVARAVPVAGDPGRAVVTGEAVRVGVGPGRGHGERGRVLVVVVVDVGGVVARVDPGEGTRLRRGVLGRGAVAELGLDALALAPPIGAARDEGAAEDRLGRDARRRPRRLGELQAAPFHLRRTCGEHPLLVRLEAVARAVVEIAVAPGGAVN